MPVPFSEWHGEDLAIASEDWTGIAQMGWGLQARLGAGGRGMCVFWRSQPPSDTHTQREAESERREILIHYLLVYSPADCNSQGWIRLGQEPGTPSTSGRGQVLELTSTAFQDAY